MTDDASIFALARRAGIAPEWEDYTGKQHLVSLESIKRILSTLGLPCGTPDELAWSRQTLQVPALPPLITAAAGAPIDLPMVLRQTPDHIGVTHEDGTSASLQVCGGPRGLRASGISTLGYHTVEVGNERTTIAVAPPRCLTVADIAPGERVWGIAAQIYGLRMPSDCGIGDMTGVAALAKAAAALKGDALALSPMHALFAADPRHYSPYSPSSRLFYNALHADPRIVFGDIRVQKAAAEAGIAARALELEQSALIDWPQSARVKMSVFRSLFENFRINELETAPNTALAADFSSYRAAGGTLLEDHARFEALHAHMIDADPAVWSWDGWPAPYRDPRSAEVKAFAEKNRHEITFNCFLQWIAERSVAAAQHVAMQAGMRIGLLADLAVGMSGAGSHAWTSQKDILVGLQIGAPPDLYNANGQNWGLTTFSPRALSSGGFSPFIATLRACLRHTGGLRIDHVMGLLRLWVIPQGADAKDGAYLAFPIDDLIRLTALESHRHGAVVIGEDLGTVPSGFRETLDQAGIYGMRVLWFERERNRFTPPRAWPVDAAAMTSTHDLPSVAGWWRGRDIETRAHLGLVTDAGAEKTDRENDRTSLWRVFRRAKAGHGNRPALTDTSIVADAAVKFIAETKSRLALLPLEDALALDEQVNLPGTITEHPNWRRRYPPKAADLLDTPEIRQRLEPLAQRPRQ
jgi:4-alpha-glucanotransferase